MKHMYRFAAPLLATVSLATMSHAAAPKIVSVATAAPTTAVDFEVFLPLRNKDGLQKLLAAQQTVGSASYHKWLTPAQFAAEFGPFASTFSGIESQAKAAGLQVTAVHTRSFHVSGTAAQASKFVGGSLNAVTFDDGHTQLRTSKPTALPSALKDQGVVIPAFTSIPAKQTHFRKVSGPLPANRYSPEGPYWFDDMKQAYNYPSYQTRDAAGHRLTGVGVHVAVLMATSAQQSDVDQFFTHEHWTDITHMNPPKFNVLNVDGGAPFNPNSNASFEASLDVQQVLGGAPGSSVTLVSIPDLFDSRILDGYVAIVDGNKWDLVNSSFGGCELGYTPPYNEGVDETGVLRTYDEVFAQGNAQGITFVASSGDSAGLSCPSVNYFFGATDARFVPSVETPADDPNVTAVGGGNLITTTPPNPQTTPPTLTSKYVTENALSDPEVPYDIYGFGANVSGGRWGAGGGQSVVFARPTYQNWVLFFGNNVTGRAIPDVGMQVGGCPNGLAARCNPSDSAAVVTFAGGNFGVIGTSVSSPEFVGALALVEQNGGGRLGNVNPFLWAQGFTQVDLGGAKAAAPAKFFHKGQIGYNGVVHTTDTVGFDYMYGNGSPNMRTLFGLTADDPAGDPQTISNP
ncbi:MAG TPA: protease pro-enzyme activation domain-containing protein [Caulobacteraceae bacterium]